MILSMALFLPSLVSILVSTSLLIAFWTCLMTGKSALLLVAAVCGSPGASPDVVLELAADEELAGGNPRASAIIVCCGVARTWPTRDEDDDEMEDLRVEILDVPVAAPFPLPFSSAVILAGPRAANAAPPPCCKRPAHMQWAGGLGYFKSMKTMRPTIPAIPRRSWGPDAARRPVELKPASAAPSSPPWPAG